MPYRVNININIVKLEDTLKASKFIYIIHLYYAACIFETTETSLWEVGVSMCLCGLEKASRCIGLHEETYEKRDAQNR